MKAMSLFVDYCSLYEAIYIITISDYYACERMQPFLGCIGSYPAVIKTPLGEKEIYSCVSVL